MARLRPFGARLIGAGRRSGSDLHPDVAAGIDAYYPVDQLSDALTQSDLLVVCMPLTAQTRGLIGAAELAMLRPGGLLINVGRGPLVDHDALVAALRSGQLAGAGLGVPLGQDHREHEDLHRDG
ncbi:MAG: NAD(P)-dependent oxidoreductase [Pseudonocardiaceae bacterium]